MGLQSLMVAACGACLPPANSTCYSSFGDTANRAASAAAAPATQPNPHTHSPSPGQACIRCRPARAPTTLPCPAFPHPQLRRARWCQHSLAMASQGLVSDAGCCVPASPSQHYAAIRYHMLPTGASFIPLHPAEHSRVKVGLSTYWMSARERSCTSYMSGRQYTRPSSICGGTSRGGHRGHLSRPPCTDGTASSQSAAPQHFPGPQGDGSTASAIRCLPS